MKNKRMAGKWIWLAIVVLVIIGVGAYLLLLGNDVSSIPQPPMLPS